MDCYTKTLEDGPSLPSRLLLLVVYDFSFLEFGRIIIIFIEVKSVTVRRVPKSAKCTSCPPVGNQPLEPRLAGLPVSRHRFSVACYVTLLVQCTQTQHLHNLVSAFGIVIMAWDIYFILWVLGRVRSSGINLSQRVQGLKERPLCPGCIDNSLYRNSESSVYWYLDL